MIFHIIFLSSGHPICPFKIFRLFMSKLSISSNYLWQRPKPHSKMSECWFHPDASNTINNDWLLDLTEKASMTVSYTNMSLVLTPRSVMDSTLSDPIFTKTYSNEVLPSMLSFHISELLLAKVYYEYSAGLRDDNSISIHQGII